MNFMKKIKNISGKPRTESHTRAQRRPKSTELQPANPSACKLSGVKTQRQQRSKRFLPVASCGFFNFIFDGLSPFLDTSFLIFIKMKAFPAVATIFLIPRSVGEVIAMTAVKQPCSHAASSAHACSRLTWSTARLLWTTKEEKKTQV